MTAPSNCVRISALNLTAYALNALFFADQRQEAFTGALSTFFHEFLQVDASAAHTAGAGLGPASPTASRTSAPVMTPTAKSASKSRKSEKRKSDAL